MGEFAALLVAGVLIAPHVMPLGRVSPVAAGAVWLAALAARAVVVVGLALAALVVLPGTVLFERVSGWKLHQGTGSVHLDLSGEPVAHLAALAPPGLVVVALVAFALSVARGAIALHRELGSRALGRGPRDSVVIADPGLLVAVPGLGPARILLSDRALTELDEAELEGCLAHEAAHLHRFHRPLGLLAGCLAAVARPIPGTRAAERGLRLSLERDADEAAVARTGDPLALASAICKVAGQHRPAAPAMGVAGAGGTKARLDGLLAGEGLRGGSALERGVAAMASLMALAVVALIVGLALWLVDAAAPAGIAAALACAP
jgi:Zn-dependent protease with chaperone function